MLELSFLCLTATLRWWDFFVSQQKCFKPFIIHVKVMKHECFIKSSCLKVRTQSWTLHFCEIHRLVPTKDNFNWSTITFSVCPSKRGLYRIHPTWQQGVNLTVNGIDSLSLTSTKKNKLYTCRKLCISINIMVSLQRQVVIAKKVSELR